MTWRVQVTDAADADFEHILAWTMGRFGAGQSLAYSETIRSALSALAAGPPVLGAMTRKELGEDLYTLHVARNGRRGRHLILFRADEQRAPPTIDVLRILHESMDLVRHVPREE